MVSTGLEDSPHQGRPWSQMSLTPDLYESRAVAHAWHPEGALASRTVGAWCQGWDEVQQVSNPIQKLDSKL